MDRLLDLTQGFSQLQVLVIGDGMLDCYLWGTCEGLSPEAPVPIVDICQNHYAAGGAANSAVNAARLGAQVHFLSVIGTDEAGDRLQQQLQQANIATEWLIRSSDRTTLTKQRIMADAHLALRCDWGSTEALDGELENRLVANLWQHFALCHAVIVSDYSYGILTQRAIATLATLQANMPRVVVVDAKQLALYDRVKPTAVKPNYKQALELLQLSPQAGKDRLAEIQWWGEAILKQTGAASVAVTCDVDGVVLLERGNSSYCLPTQAAPNINASGAGDTFTSAFTLALAAGATPHEAAEIASAAAAIVVQDPGTTTCDLVALQQAIAPKFSLPYPPI